jgi:hypothetical protein
MQVHSALRFCILVIRSDDGLYFLAETCCRILSEYNVVLTDRNACLCASSVKLRDTGSPHLPSATAMAVIASSLRWCEYETICSGETSLVVLMTKTANILVQDVRV